MSGTEDTSSESDGSDSDDGDESPPALNRRQQYAVVALAAVAALLVGMVFASVAYNATNSTQESAETDVDGTVAVVTIEGPIAGNVGEQLEKELREIRANDSIDAVVLNMNTPGGAPQPTEKMYMAIQRTNQEMPVIASVGQMSASAGYYMMLPAEDIYVLPTSIVGSVGLAAGAPSAQSPVRGPSGPDKRGSNPTQQWAYQDTLGQIFLETVMEQRGDRIELSKEEVSTAKVFLGVNAVENGYADELGSTDDAIAAAAERAGLDNYTVTKRSVSLQTNFPIFAQTDSGLVTIHDEDPSYADVKPVRYAWVYKPAIPHIEELDQVVSDDVAEKLEEESETETAETDDTTDARAGGVGL